MPMAPITSKPCILSLQFFSAPDAFGGAWNYTHEVNRRLAARGHRVHLITCKPREDLAADEVIDGVRFHRIGCRDSKRFFTLGRRIRQFVRSIAREEDIRLVHVHNPLVGLLALTCPKLWKTPKVIQLQSLWYDEERINRLGPEGRPGFGSSLWWRLQFIRCMEWALFARAGTVLFLSRFMQKQFVEYFPGRGSRQEVIPGGVDTRRFHPPEGVHSRARCRETLALPADAPVFLTVRRLEPRMGLDRLLDAAAQIVQQRPDLPFKLVMVGKGSQREALAQRIQSLELQDRVRLEGEVDADRLPMYFGAADVFVLPTAALEGFGLATVEALACGLPVLGTPIGATVEILNPLDPRLLFGDSSSGAMAEGLMRFLDQPEPYLALKPLCRDTAVSRYDWERVVDRIEGTFQEVHSG
ncbi:MAG: glycosyltransferase family 4 protein [Nitrospinaceae bacterium]